VLGRVRFVVPILLLMLLPAVAAGQDPPPPPPPDSLLAAEDTTDATPNIIRPRTAMIRSWLIPGWGQASARAYFRGGVFVAMQSASWYMLVKTIGRLEQARSMERTRVTWVSDSLRALIFSDPTGAGAELQTPATFQQVLDEDERIVAVRALVDSRSQQRQDWITATLFLTLISGVDAFVAAHLAEAPASIDATPLPGGGVQLGVRVPVGSVGR
jgi:hypothetical protein